MDTLTAMDLINTKNKIIKGLSEHIKKLERELRSAREPQRKPVTGTERQVYIRHISRLKQENTLLRAELAEQIARRNRAWLWYRQRVKNFFPLMLDALAWYVRSIRNEGE